MEKKIEDSVVPDHIQEHFERIAKGHADWYFKDVRWLLEMMLCFSEKVYKQALVHGGKHGYEAALKDIKTESARIKED